MPATATLVSTDLVELFDTVPEYEEYRSTDTIQNLEADYRIALGRLAKSWGDQLLDVAERPMVPLSQEEARAIDTLLERISEIFEQLNSFRISRCTGDDAEAELRMRRSDAQIMSAAESATRILHELHPNAACGHWLQTQGGSLQRRLRRLSRELRRRNRVLGQQQGAEKKSRRSTAPETRSSRRSSR